MGITISNNGAVQRASYHLADAQEKFQLSIRRLASGKRIIGANEDPGTLAVSMKVRASVERLVGAANNVRSGIGFLEVQDGLLDTAGKILMRMSELKGYHSQDPLKSPTDSASYDEEFKDLQLQLYQISTISFNSQNIFAKWRMNNDGTEELTDTEEGIFGAENQVSTKDNTIDIFTSSSGSEGTKVSLHRSLLLSALIVSNDGLKIAKDYYDETTASGTTELKPWEALSQQTDIVDSAGNTDQDEGFLTLAKNDESTLLSLEDVSAQAIETAITNVVYLRSQTGGGMSRLQFAMDTIATQETNMRSALGRIEDVDMASESANLAKYGILMQASAAMVTQANLSNEVALSLIRGM